MKRIVFFAALLVLLIAAFCVVASAEIYEGRALDEGYIHGWEDGVPPEGYQEAYKLAAYYDVQYRLDTETGELRIFCGETNPQKMLPYAEGAWVPWTKDSMRPYIKTVIIEEGILSVGTFSFYKCENLETVYLPISLLRVDETAFYECPKLKTIHYAGNRSDFQKYVEWKDVRNSYTGDVVERKAIDLVVFGESVTVYCKNQDGEIFQTYKIGGYAAGNEFSIVPPELAGLRYVGKNNEIIGKFREADSRKYVLEYICSHEYKQVNELQFCSRFCVFCGCCDPAYESEHIFAIKKEIKRGLFRDGELDKTCSVCGLRRYQSELAYIWTVLTAASAFVIVAALFCVVFFPIRRWKRIKDLTW